MIISCNSTDELELKFRDYYLTHPQCKLKQSCKLKLSDITWFRWDRVELREDEAGINWEFILDNKVVYKYLKSTDNYFQASGIEFGLGDKSINSSYSKDSAIFNLEVVEKKGDFIYFLLPL